MHRRCSTRGSWASTASWSWNSMQSWACCLPRPARWRSDRPLVSGRSCPRTMRGEPPSPTPVSKRKSPIQMPPSIYTPAGMDTGVTDAQALYHQATLASKSKCTAALISQQDLQHTHKAAIYLQALGKHVRGPRQVRAARLGDRGGGGHADRRRHTGLPAAAPLPRRLPGTPPPATRHRSSLRVFRTFRSRIRDN